jgi:aquaporin Z
MKDWKKYFAEFLGTALLVFVSCGVAVYSQDFVATALAFGLTLMVSCYTIGDISGSHVNPAVSFGLLINNKISCKDFAFYVLSQVLGAAFGGVLLFVIAKIMSPDTVAAVGANFYETITVNAVWQQILLGLLVEILMTFVFVFTVIAATRKSSNKYIAGIVIGLTLALVHLFAMPFTGTSVNPARSLGVAFFGGIDALKQVWLFIVAPMFGAGLAALVSRVIYPKDEIIGDENTKEIKKEVKEAKSS